MYRIILIHQKRELQLVVTYKHESTIINAFSFANHNLLF